MSPSSKQQRGQRRRQPHAIPLLFSVAALALVGGLIRKSPVPEPASRPAAPTRESSEVHAAVARPVEALDYASDGVPIHPRGSAEPPPNTATHPHGFTPAHERIYRENNLVGQLDGAMDANDVPAMRRLLAQYRDEYPEDSHEMQVGYELIVDCLESPNDREKRAVAQRYYDAKIQSGLRRYIRRHCFEHGG